MASPDVFEKKGPVESADAALSSEAESTHIFTPSSPQNLRRNLRGKEVQLFAIGGAIGTGTSLLSNIPGLRCVIDDCVLRGVHQYGKWTHQRWTWKFTCWVLDLGGVYVGCE
jgi:hypothetical protein